MAAMDTTEDLDLTDGARTITEVILVFTAFDRPITIRPIRSVLRHDTTS